VTQHLDDDAELYALGFTERERSEEIEAHLATCAACCERVAAAESVAASLAAALPPMPAAAPQRRTWWPQLATAAAVVFAATTALEGGLVHVASNRVQRTDVALTALASTHFAHTTLTSRPGLIAKAIYSRQGAWAYVVASGAPAGAHVVLRQGAAQRDLGALDDGAPATLFISRPGLGDEYDIVSNGNVIAHGKPQY
jgi:energy-converting hydrogenase Eha subunit A